MKESIQRLISTMPARWQAAIFNGIERRYRRRAHKAKRNELSSLQKPEWMQRYLAFNQQHVDAHLESPDGLILVDCFPAPHWIIANSIFLNTLAKQYNASVASYGSLPRPAALEEIYVSFGASQHLEIQLTPAQYRKCTEMFQQICTNVRSPQELFELTIDGIWLGLDIYESTLRIGKPTVQPHTYHTNSNLFQALVYLVYFTDLMKSGRIKAVALSHDCYVQMGTLMKIAHRHQVPVYFANPFEMMRSTKTHDIYDKFKKYPDYFNQLEKSSRDSLIDKARHALSMRLGGAIGVDMSYQTKSAFASEQVERQTSHSNKLKIVVTTHCFYDNPHAYSRMTFRDFYQWMEFLGEISIHTDYEWYIKPHRDYLPGTMQVLRDFAVKYPRFKLVNPETSFHQLRHEGVTVALTCYGSVGHELPLLGYRVINATFNPHSAYTFNTHCITIEQYADALMHLNEPAAEPDLNNLYEFYAVHHYLVKSDSLLFESFVDYEAYVDGDLMSDRGYAYFMNAAEENLARYRARAEAFLAAGCHYEFELRLPNWLPQPYGSSTNK
ncbi:hypothetical protein [Pollutimonas sp. M17]|uniref:hypothetical protein n=1 Tax=Pollutimonas sp. M17 TaxID=2962065 RepID=UPI0021F475AE|nr:hypothetical protein [Pollutimonas sp. M17]UYO93970.1 hypothetical protein OEG81_01160 [Pollutimonas sp. M17]